MTANTKHQRDKTATMSQKLSPRTAKEGRFISYADPSGPAIQARATVVNTHGKEVQNYSMAEVCRPWKTASVEQQWQPLTRRIQHKHAAAATEDMDLELIAINFFSDLEHILTLSHSRPGPEQC